MKKIQSSIYDPITGKKIRNENIDYTAKIYVNNTNMYNNKVYGGKGIISDSVLNSFIVNVVDISKNQLTQFYKENDVRIMIQYKDTTINDEYYGATTERWYIINDRPV